MSDGGAAPKVSRKVLSRRDNHEGIISREGRQMGAAAKYELRNPATSRAAELEIMSGLRSAHENRPAAPALRRAYKKRLPGD